MSSRWGILDFFFNTENKVIVNWAAEGEDIPLTCRKCGFTFITKNEKYIGYKKVHYGKDVYGCEYHNMMKHSAAFLFPDYKYYKKHIR